MCFNYASASALASIPVSEVTQGKMREMGKEQNKIKCSFLMIVRYGYYRTGTPPPLYMRMCTRERGVA